MDDLARLQARCIELEEDNAQLRSINEALMNRVERDTDLQGSTFSLFQAAIALEGKVKERTAALTDTLHVLEQTNRELQSSNAAAQAASRAKSAFLAAMSHELRTPMNGVVGMSELLLARPLEPGQRESAQVIRHSALSLLRILNDILDFSKIEAGRLDTESTAFDLRMTTDKTLLPLRPQIEGKGLAFELDWPEDLPTAVVGDPIRYAQILTNLVGNAMKFTSHGQIRLSARLLRADDASLSLRFDVEDTGIGIRDEVLPRLFDSFTQADSSTTRQYGGTGLGLAIVRSLCHLLGGDCGASSQFGKGSCFWFSLTFIPASWAQSQALSDAMTIPDFQKASLPTGANDQIRVLVVEDNPVNQLVARGFLEFLGCACSLVGNGRLAVDALVAPHAYDLVLMDCQMPEMDGLEATRRVRAHEAGRGCHVPIIALTANAMAGDRETCLGAGMDDFLSKPFQRDELERILDTWCPRQGPRRARIATDIMD